MSVAVSLKTHRVCWCGGLQEDAHLGCEQCVAVLCSNACGGLIEDAHGAECGGLMEDAHPRSEPHTLKLLVHTCGGLAEDAHGGFVWRSL